jgi:hypothetical protein
MLEVGVVAGRGKATVTESDVCVHEYGGGGKAARISQPRRQIQTHDLLLIALSDILATE